MSKFHLKNTLEYAFRQGKMIESLSTLQSQLWNEALPDCFTIDIGGYHQLHLSRQVLDEYVRNNYSFSQNVESNPETTKKKHEIL